MNFWSPLFPRRKQAMCAAVYDPLFFESVLDALREVGPSLEHEQGAELALEICQALVDVNQGAFSFSLACSVLAYFPNLTDCDHADLVGLFCNYAVKGSREDGYRALEEILWVVVPQPFGLPEAILAPLNAAVGSLNLGNEEDLQKEEGIQKGSSNERGSNRKIIGDIDNNFYLTDIEDNIQKGSSNDRYPYNTYHLGASSLGVREINLDNSVPLDVHLWSEHKSISSIVDKIYEKGFSGSARIKKKHIRVVLVHLYATYKISPYIVTSISFRPSDYKAGSRYNKLHISKTTIEVCKTLFEIGYVHLKRGFYDRQRGIGRQTRIWPTQELIDLFDNSLDVKDIIPTIEQHQELVRLKGTDGKLVEYQDTPQTMKWRSDLERYNAFIQTQKVDHYHNQGLVKTQLYRVFNSDWEHGGRLYNGFWITLPSFEREHITINGKATVEIDYKALHPTLLYRLEGIELLKGFDPYDVGSDIPRHVAKYVMLVAINAKSDKQAFSATRAKAKDELKKLGSRVDLAGDVLSSLYHHPSELISPHDAEKAKRLAAQKKAWEAQYEELKNLSHMKDEKLASVLSKIREHNKEIAHYLCQGEGLRLQRIDSDLVMYVLSRLTELEVPCLPIHDSFIVAREDEGLLKEAMEDAIREVLPLTRIPPLAHVWERKPD